jgi:hypothetical protein
MLGYRIMQQTQCEPELDPDRPSRSEFQRIDIAVATHVEGIGRTLADKSALSPENVERNFDATLRRVQTLVLLRSRACGVLEVGLAVTCGDLPRPRHRRRSGKEPRRPGPRRAPGKAQRVRTDPATCVLDAGNNGVMILADKMLPPAGPPRSSPAFSPTPLFER